MKKGEVWRICFPSSPGRAQAGERPAVIVQNDPSLTSLPVVLVVPFTSRQLLPARFAGTLTVQPDGVNGLFVQSVALVFQRQDKRSFLHRLGEVDPPTLDATADRPAARTLVLPRPNTRFCIVAA